LRKRDEDLDLWGDDDRSERSGMRVEVSIRLKNPGIFEGMRGRFLGELRGTEKIQGVDSGWREMHKREEGTETYT